MKRTRVRTELVSGGEIVAVLWGIDKEGVGEVIYEEPEFVNDRFYEDPKVIQAVAHLINARRTVGQIWAMLPTSEQEKSSMLTTADADLATAIRLLQGEEE